MENRFLEIDETLKRVTKNGLNGNSSEGSDLLSSAYSLFATPLSAADRVLVVLIENGGIDLNISRLVDALWQYLPGSRLLPDSLRSKLAQFLEKKIKSYTDSLLESAEMALNRYAAAKPEYFGDVIMLRDGTASYADLKNTLFAHSKKGKLIDLFILTHGSGNFISVTGGIDGDKIRAMKSENGKPLSIRSVYMMNCVGASLNQAWLDAGAKASAGSIRNNYLPEPTMYFFWKNWKEGQSFESAVTSAYRKTIAVMNALANELLQLIPGGTQVVGALNFENMDFVRDSAPVIQGQRSVTITTDNLSFAQTFSSSLATTVLPAGFLRSLALSDPDAGAAKIPRTLSQQGVDLIKSFEGFRSKLYDDDAGHCTVGYGTLVHTGKCDGREAEAPYAKGITEAQATQLLAHKVQEFEKTINDNVQVVLGQNQFDALVSFVYNIGGGNFKQSTLLKVLNQGNYEAVPPELKKWTKARQNGKLVDLPGMVKRRQAEAELFQKPEPAMTKSLSTFYYSMDAKPTLKLGQKVPDKSEVDVVGAIKGKIKRGSVEFKALVENTNVDIVFKDEEKTGADHMMTSKLKTKIDALANLVKTEWPGKKLRVTEAWDEDDEHSGNSSHYEGRAADITVSDLDKGKLGRLGQLAVDAGFDWVFYENAEHVHASMSK
jgi:GH24 family phage-related lysozyme (muramidase)